MDRVGDGVEGGQEGAGVAALVEQRVDDVAATGADHGVADGARRVPLRRRRRRRLVDAAALPVHLLRH